MYIKTKAIILSVIKYNDYDAIAQAYTQKTGFTAYFLKNFFNKKTKKLKKAYFQPGTLLEILATDKQNSQLEYIKEVKIYYHYKNIHLNFNKLNIATFMREVLIESLKNEQEDTKLFQFIEKSFIQLDQQDFKPDFHIIFLINLTRFLGFFPDYQTQGNFFDMTNGKFSSQMQSSKYATAEESLIFKKYLGMIFDLKKTTLKHNERKKILDFLMEYYELHIAKFTVPKSVKILHKLYE